MNYKDWSSYIRDFKLSIITGDLDPKVETRNINRFKKELNFIKDNFPNDVITGSLSLNLLGILERDISDIDIIIDDGTRYEDYHLGHVLYGQLRKGEVTMSNRLGYIVFTNKKTGLFNRLLSKKDYYKIDFFESKDVNYTEFSYNNHFYKIHNPIEVLTTKSNLEDEKHENDLITIFK